MSCDAGGEQLSMRFGQIEPPHRNQRQHLVAMAKGWSPAKHALEPKSHLADVVKEACPRSDIPQRIWKRCVTWQRWVPVAPTGETGKDIGCMSGERLSVADSTGGTLRPYVGKDIRHRSQLRL